MMKFLCNYIEHYNTCIILKNNYKLLINDKITSNNNNNKVFNKKMFVILAILVFIEITFLMNARMDCWL
jgi:hypothetical protein